MHWYQFLLTLHTLVGLAFLCVVHQVRNNKTLAMQAMQAVQAVQGVQGVQDVGFLCGLCGDWKDNANYKPTPKK